MADIPRNLAGARLALALAAIVVAGCSGGDGTDGGGPPAAVAGTVTKGPVQFANVSFYAFDVAGAASGSALATTTTDASGQFTLPSFTPPAGAAFVLVKACGNGLSPPNNTSYVDEADPEPDPTLKRRIALGTGDCIEGVHAVGTVDVAVTPYAMAMLKKARVQAAGANFSNVLLAVQGQVTTVFGFDPFVTVPADPITGAGGNQGYAILLGAAAQAINGIATDAGHLPGFGDVEMFVNDFADGRLNGACPGSLSPCPALAVDLGSEIRRFRNNNISIYGGTAEPSVNEGALEQPANVPNIAPTISAIADQSIAEEGNTGALSFTIADTEDAATALTVSGSSTNTTLVPVTNIVFGGSGGSRTVTVTPVANGFGSATITVVVTDTLGGTASEPFLLTVTNINDPPLINSTAPTSATEDTVYTYNATVNDSDGPAPTWSLAGANTCAGALINASTGVYTFTPAGPSPVGSCVVGVQVSDGGSPVTQTTTVNITAVNDLPVINSTASTTATEDTLYTYPATVNDPDGPAPSWSLGTGHTCGGSINSSSGVFSFTPAGPVPPANCLLRVQVTDGGTPVTQSTTVTITAVNDAPTINSTPPATAAEDAPYTYNATVSDPDGATPSWSLAGTNTCAGASINPSSGAYTFTPVGPAPPASCDVGVQVSDGGSPVTQTTTITITPANDPPAFGSAIYTTSVDENVPFGFPVITADATDPDLPGDTLIYSITAGNNVFVPSVGNVDAFAIDSAGLITVNEPAAVDYELFTSFSLTVQVDDGNGGSDTATVDIAVNDLAEADGTLFLPFRDNVGNLKLIDPRVGLASVVQIDSGVAEHNDSNPNSYATIFGADIDGGTGDATNIRQVRLVYVKGGQVFAVNLDSGTGPTQVSTITDACRIHEVAEDFVDPDNSSVFVSSENGDGCDNGNDLPKALLGLTPSATVVAAPTLQRVRPLHASTGAVTGYLAMFGISESDATTLKRCDASFNCATTLVTFGGGGGNFHFMEDTSFDRLYLGFRDADDPAPRLYRYDVALGDFSPSLTAPTPLHQFAGFTHSGSYDGTHYYFPDGTTLNRVGHAATSSELLVTMPDNVEDVEVSSGRAVFETRSVTGISNVYSVLKAGGSATPLMVRALVANESAQFEYVDAGGRVFINTRIESGGVRSAESSVQVLDTGSGFAELPDSYYAGGARATSFNLETTQELPALALLRVTHDGADPSTDTLESIGPVTGAVLVNNGILLPLVRFEGIRGQGVGRYIGVEAIWSGDGLHDVHLADAQSAGITVVSSSAGEQNWVFFEDVGDEGGGGGGDADSDGLTDSQEASLGTNPNNPDTDGDGFNDFTEVNQDSNPNDFNPGAGDSNPNSAADTPGDGNDAPVANDDAISVAEGASATTLVGGATSVISNDTDPELNALTATLVTGPANAATFMLNADGTFTYLHDNSETTTDSFTYTVNDGLLDSNVATVSISITPVNDPPVAVADGYNMSPDTTLTVDAGDDPSVPVGLLFNDTDAEDGVPVTAVSPTAPLCVPDPSPASCTLDTFSGDGSFSFTPPAGYSGTMTFQYQARDSLGADSAVATVTVTIGASGESFLPYFTAAGDLKLIDPANPGSPILLESGLPTTGFDAQTLIRADVAGGIASNIRPARLVYIKVNGPSRTVWKVNLEAGQSHSPVQVSNIADACKFNGEVEDFANPDNTIVRVDTAGTDGVCGNGGGDDFTTAEAYLVPLTTGAGSPGIQVGLGHCCGSVGLADTNGALVGVLTTEDDGAGTTFALRRRNVGALGTPIEVATLDIAGNGQIYTSLTRGFGDQHVYIRARVNGDTNYRLHRVNVGAGNTLTPVYDYGTGDAATFSGDLDTGTYDSSNFYFTSADGLSILRVAHSAVGLGEEAILLNGTAGDQVAQIQQSIDRLVFEIEGPAGGVFSVPKAGGGVLTLLADSVATPTFVKLAGMSGALALIDVVTGTTPDFIARSVTADGSSPNDNPDAQWVGASFDSCDFANDCDSSAPAQAIYLRHGAFGSTADIEIVDPLTGVPTGDFFPSLFNVSQGPAVFGAGFGRYVQFTVFAAAEHTDLWLGDLTQTGPTPPPTALQSVITDLGDDQWLTFGSEDQGGGGPTDSDGDGLTDAQEASLGTNPNDPDSDGDGVSDFVEVNRDGDPNNYTVGTDTDPNNPDTDGDGMPDGTDPDPLVAGGTTALLPFVTAAGELKLLDPTQVVTAGNPQTVDSGLSVNVIQDNGARDYIALGSARNARLIYLKAGQVFKVNLDTGADHTPVRVSSLSTVCRLQPENDDLADVDNSLMTLVSAGTDNTCNTGDDVRTFIHLSAGPANPGITPTALQNVEGIRDPGGAIVDYLTNEGGSPGLYHRDINFANPTLLLSLATPAGGPNYEPHGVGLNTGIVYLKLLLQGQTQSQLFRYVLGGPLSPSLYTFSTLASSDSGFQAAEDGTNLYFNDGNTVQRIPISATTAGQVSQVTNVGAGQRVDDLELSGSSNRLVFVAEDSSGNGGVYSVLKTDTNNPSPTVLSANVPASNIFVDHRATTQGRTYVDVHQGAAVSLRIVNDDGTVPVDIPNAYVACGAFSQSFDVAYMVLATRSGGNDTLQILDPVTGSATITLGTISNTAAPFGGINDTSVPVCAVNGFGRYSLTEATIDRGGGTPDKDVYFFDSQFAGSLQALATHAGSDDVAQLGEGGGGASQPDNDFDGLSNAQETTLGTNPNNPDSDGDGFSDYTEVNQDGNPNTYAPGNGDSDPLNAASTPGAPAGPTATLLPIMTAGGELQLYDPTLPVSGSNPFTVDTNVPANAFRNEGNLFEASIDSGSGDWTDLHRRALAYVKNGRVYRVDLLSGADNSPAQASSITDACSIADILSDNFDALNSALLVQTRGSNGVCEVGNGGTFGDDLFYLVNVSASSSTGGTQIPTRFRNIKQLNDSAGHRIGSLGVGGTCSPSGVLVRRDANFANPQTVLALNDCNVFTYSFRSTEHYFRARGTADASFKLYRYNVGPNTLEQLFTFVTETGPSSGNPDTYDGNNFYFRDGTQLHRVPHGSTSVSLITTTASPVDRIAPTSTRVVYTISGPTGGIFSAAQSGGGVVTLASNSASVNNTLFRAQGDRVFYKRVNSTVLTTHHVMHDGTSPTTISGILDFIGATLPTAFNEQTTPGDAFPAHSLLGADSLTPNAGLIVIDPDTGSTTVNLGTIANYMTGGFSGVGRYAVGEIQIERGGGLFDTDVYAVDMLTGGSLAPLATTAGNGHDDDFDPLNGDHGGGPGGDSDGDGLTDSQESALGTLANNPDSDGDGFSDFDEVNQDGNPNDYNPGGGDTDPNVPAGPAAPAFNLFPTSPYGVAIFGNSGIGPYQITDVNDPSGSNTYIVTLTLSAPLDALDPLQGSLFVRDNVSGGVIPGEITMNGTTVVQITSTLAAINTTLQSVDGTGEPDGLKYQAVSSPFSGRQLLQVDVDDLSGPGGQATQPTDVYVRRVELADSDTDPSLTRFDGVALGDSLGLRTSGSAGDFDGDGQKDFVTSASRATPLGRTRAGTVYVAFSGSFSTPSGGPDPVALSGGFDGTNGFTVIGASNQDQIGTSYTLAGDLDWDGYDDLVIGAQRAFASGINPGRVYVVFGGQSVPGGVLDLANPSPGVRMLVFTGLADFDFLGRAEFAGDLNRDGHPDLVMSAPTADPGSREDAGQVYVVFSAPFGTLSPNCGSGTCFYEDNVGTNRLSLLDGSNGFTVNGIDGGPFDTPNNLSTGDQIGYTIAPLGDFNGDRVDDFMIGSGLADPDGARVDAGQAYVIFGKTTGQSFPPVIELSALAGLGVTLNGETGESYLDGGGIATVAAAGDTDGDGKGDLLIGYPNGDGGGRTDAGIAYIVYGGALPSVVELADVGSSVAGFRLLGANDADRLGGRTRKAGDVNRDGIDDFAVSAPGRDPHGRTDAGSAYLIFGKAGGYSGTVDLATNDGRIAVVYNGAVTGDLADGGLGTTGDLDNDGYDDFSFGGGQPDPSTPGTFLGPGLVYAAFGADLRRVLDSDGDGLSDDYESYLGLNASSSDSDGDSLDDRLELRVLRTDPNSADTDGDTINDGAELAVGDPLAYDPGYDTDPNNADTDGDGQNDNVDANPLVAVSALDTDGDGVSDNIEGFVGADPSTPNVVVHVSADFGVDGQSGINWGESVRTAQNAVSKLDALGPYPGDPLQTYFVLFDQTGDSTHPGPLTLTGATLRQNVAFVGGLGPGYSEPGENARTLLSNGGLGPVVEVSNATNIVLGALQVAFGNATTGGGVYLHDTDGAVQVFMPGAVVHDNTAQDGGGIAVVGAGVQLGMEDGDVFGNTASSGSTNGRGGGLYVAGGQVTISKTTFRSNLASNLGGPAPTHGGGGIYAEANAVLDIQDSVLAANKAVNGPGGGINAVGAGGVVLRHSKLLSNESSRPGAGLHAHIDAPAIGTFEIFNNIFVGNASTDSDAEGGAWEIEYNTDAATLLLNSNTAAYNQITTNALTGFGGGVNVTNATAPSTAFDFNNNIAWFNDNATVDIPTTPEPGDNLFLQAPFNAAGNDVNESGFAGNTAGMPLDPQFLQGFFLVQASNPLIDGGSGTSAFWGLDSQYFTEIGNGLDTGTVDIGAHQSDGGDGTLNGVAVNTVNGSPPSIVCGNADIVFTPVFQFQNDGSGHLVAVEFSGVTGPVTLSSLTTLDPLGSGTSKLAKDLGDGRYLIQSNGFGNGTATFSIYADGQPVPQTFQLAYTSAC